MRDNVAGRPAAFAGRFDELQPRVIEDRLRRRSAFSARRAFARSGPMTAGSAAAPHVPVLLRAALEQLNVRDSGVYIDGTFGAGGYTGAILQTPNTQVIGRSVSTVMASRLFHWVVSSPWNELSAS